MVRHVLTALAVGALASASTACIDWGSLYAEPGGSDIDAGGSNDTPDATVQPGEGGCSDGVIEVASLEDPGTSGLGIVACGGAWAVPGVVNAEETTCGRGAGDDGENLSGEGCSAGDLCAIGWHVCLGADDVTAHQGESLCSQLRDGEATYVTRQSATPDQETCGPGEGNESGDDVFGCGTLGLEATNCSPLDRRLALIEDSPEQSGCPHPFNCGEDPLAEAANITKVEPSGGGVLCCHD